MSQNITQFMHSYKFFKSEESALTSHKINLLRDYKKKKRT